MLTVSIRYLIMTSTRKAEYSHFEIITGSTFNQAQITVSFNHPGKIKLQLHDAIYRLRFYSNSLINILSLSNSHNNVASIQKNRGDKSHSVIVA